MQTDFTISFGQLVTIAGGLAAIAVVIRWAVKPFKTIDDHERRIGLLEGSHAEQKEIDTYITKALNAIVNHMIDGNGIDKLREVRDEFQDKIISK